MVDESHASPWRELADKVAFLSRPETYAQDAVVERIETHMSWVFLTAAHAWKLKKPVRFPFLDFSTLEARQRSIEAEYAINQRLAPGVYLEVLPLLRDAAGDFHLDGRSAGGAVVVDWLLKMKRLPRDAMLDRAVLLEGFRPASAVPAAELLAAFYREAEKLTLTPRDYRQRLSLRLNDNLAVLSLPRYGLDPRLVERLHAGQASALECHQALFAGRAAEGRLLDGHGDLRPEHVCLTTPPVVIDRLEIDPQGRILDPIDELALLAVELELLGCPEVADIFFLSCGETGPAELIAFFKCLRACTRAKFALWHLDDPRVQDKDKWRSRAHAYLELADGYLGAWQSIPIANRRK